MDHGSASFHNDPKPISSSDSNPEQVRDPWKNIEAPSSNIISNVSVQIGAQPATPSHVTTPEEEWCMPISNLMRIMRRVLPPHAKVSEESKQTMQECVTEFISFITSEANERCQKERRKIVTAEDILWAMDTLGFDDYVHPLYLFLKRYRQSEIQNLEHLGGHVPVQQVASSSRMPLPQPLAPLLYGARYWPNLSSGPRLNQGMFDSTCMRRWNQDGSDPSGSASNGHE